MRYHPGTAIEKARFLLELDPLRSWFFYSLWYKDDRAPKGGVAGTYYEFGVGWGNSMRRYFLALQDFCRYKGRDLSQFHAFGFDSFQGLPPKAAPQDDHWSWTVGGMSTDQATVLNKVFRGTGLQPRVHLELVPGYFEKSLTPELRDRLAKTPPSIVTIDVDYYSSTKTVLEWLRPILPSGTLFYFDDIWSFHGHPKKGEIAAIREFNAQEKGWLVPFPKLSTTSMLDRTFIYAREEFEFGSDRNASPPPRATPGA